MVGKQLAAWCSLLLVGVAAAQPDLAQRFGQLPSLSMPRLSPDGRYLALQVPRDGVPAILSLDLDDGDRRQWLVATERGGFKILDCQWAKNDRLICVADYTALRDLRPYYEFAVYSLSADGKEVKEVLRYEPWVRLVNRLPDDPYHIAIEKAQERENRYLSLYEPWPSLYLLNVYTGATELLAPAKPPAWRWELSDDGRKAVAFGGGALWTWNRELGEFTSLSSPPGAVVDLVGLDREARNALLLADERGRRALLAVPLDGQTARTLVSDETYDVDGYDSLPGLTHRAGRATLLTEVVAHRWLDTGMANSQRSLDTLVPGARAFVETASQDLTRSVVRFEGDSMAPRYVLFDTASQPRVLGVEYPNVDDTKLSPVRRVRVAMRDGIEIDVFVTEPAAQPAGPAKAVVMPHGGPEARDVRGFDFIAQFLAASGYAVVQPNFRGSSGYGREFLEAGRRGWGTAMHNDITDAARWAIGEKLADAGHLCIVGSSYGGYAALLGVAKEPGLYACAVSFAGPSDLGELLFDFDKTRGPHEQQRQRDRIGWAREDLDAQSPFRLADNIEAPVLLIHGKLDTRVEMDQSQQMARALRRNDTPVELVLQDKGDHFLRDQEQRIEMLREMGRFLAEHL